MKFNTSELNPFTRFFFNPENKEEGFIELRVMPDGERKRLSRATYRETKEYKKGSRFEIMEAIHPKDPDFFDRGLWDYCIGSWDQVLNEKDENIENTAENKLMLMNGAPAFALMVQKNLAELKEMEELHGKAQVKND